ncbi:MAG: hypothetical protein KatS3mg077_2304 [Candidatus Binatia bacterium]|nr:MAG: hypothetical protein KatS3mg077_2304 [Candidatus Binatia bacterium]
MGMQGNWVADAELRSGPTRLYERGVPLETSQWMPVALVDELAERTTKKFFVTIDGVEEECFLVKYEGRFYAYVNRCCHVPMTLDWVENRFFTADGRYLQCATHGARYLPETGECVAGPPCGKFLRRLEVASADGKVYVAVGARASLEENR